MTRIIAIREILALSLVVLVSQEPTKNSETVRPFSDADLAKVEAVFEAHNRIREENELPPLSRNAKLDSAAQAHAKDMAAREVMSHEGGDGSSPAQRVDRTDYPYRLVGENVAQGQRTASSVMAAWMNSPGHKKNILGSYEQIGIGLAYSSSGRPFWSVSFGTPWPQIDSGKALSELLDAVNRVRTQALKAALRRNTRLDAVAESRATSLASAGSNGEAEDSTTRLSRELKRSKYAYRRVGILAAGGLPTPRELVQALLEDEDQKSTLLGDYEEIGLGVFQSERQVPYWALILAIPSR